jgi:hypothetical protein
VTGSRYTAVRVGGALVAGLMVAGTVAGTLPAMLRTSELDWVALDEAGLETVVLSGDRGGIRVTEAAPGQSAGVTTALTWSWTRPQVRLVAEDEGRVRVVTDGCRQDCLAEHHLILPPGTAVQVSTHLGDIDVDTTGPVDASSTLGGVDVRMTGVPEEAEDTDPGATPDPLAWVRARSTVGDVTVTVPEGTAYRVQARSSVGDRLVRVEQAVDAPLLVDAETTLGDVLVTNP